jgi:ATP-dependent helicase HrpB
MAATLGQPVGRTVGYRMRGEARLSRDTRIEVVTEGILTRMIQDDPDLPGVGAILFDEFHERSLNADLGLALALDIRGALRPDLVLLPMSATLDAAPVAALMGDAPRITADGRAFPVETRWLPRPLPREARWDQAMAGLVRQALDETPGDVLAFCPGEGEVRRVAGLLGDCGCAVRPLYGAMAFDAQRAAIAPEPDGRRKLVLATAIAETSLTIPGITVVVDGGRARRARHDPASGMTRLVTERVTRAEAVQRQGRAGRTAPGVCWRLWARAEEGALAPFPPPEIAAADLAGLALDLALWGSDRLPFLTPPPAPALAEARALLAELGALDGRGGITAHGRALAAMPLHPRLAHMLAAGGGPLAPVVAALLADRDPLRGAPPDLGLRLEAVQGRRAGDAATLDRIRAESRRLARDSGPDRGLSPGALAALAYPDRIGLRRAGEAPRWLLSGGRGAEMEPGLPLSEARMIVATDLDGAAREARVRQAVALDEGEFRALYSERFRRERTCVWDAREGRVAARDRVMFGALAVEDRPWPDAPPEAMARAALEGLRADGLVLSPTAARLRARILLARAEGADVPDVSDSALLAGDDLLPWLGKARTLGDLRSLDLTEALRTLAGWAGMAEVDRIAPAHFTTPLGRAVPIDYDGAAPGIALRLQELFGVTRHPVVGGRPLRITLLSPGGRPVQVTQDLPGFWATSYADVRKDVRGRYPRHPWPEDPTQADPTTRAKPRGT